MFCGFSWVLLWHASMTQIEWSVWIHVWKREQLHYNDVIMGTIASQITSLTIVYSTVYPVADQRKHWSSSSLAFVWGIHREPVNSPHKWPVKQKMFPFDNVIMTCVPLHCSLLWTCKDNPLNTPHPPPPTPWISSNVESISMSLCHHASHINSSPSGQNGHRFAGDIFRRIFVNDNFVFWLKFHWSLFVSVHLTILQHWFR